ncbi:MAG: sulfurtransferase TusA family protein [Magnetococcales bacterium]|nr:sulfurtransferase TusA family protein [Magnetococcales bacterium]
MPIIKVDAAIRNLEPDQVVEVRATDPGLEHDLPAWCRVNGHRFLGVRRAGREVVGWVARGE